MKTIQKVTAWRYPCDGKPIEFVGKRLFVSNSYFPAYTKRFLIDLTNGKCECGKDCKPQKITIEVKEA